MADKDNVKGQTEQARDKVERAAGKATGSEETQAHGKVHAANGKAREKVAGIVVDVKGDVKNRADEAEEKIAAIKGKAKLPAEEATTATPRRQVIASSGQFEVVGPDAHNIPIRLSAGDKIEGSFTVEDSDISFALWMLVPDRKPVVWQHRARSGYAFSYDVVESGNYLLCFENVSTTFRKYINLSFTISRMSIEHSTDSQEESTWLCPSTSAVVPPWPVRRWGTKSSWGIRSWIVTVGRRTLP